ncbi:DNA polymerase III subunit delta [Thermodesulfobacteriota bacterium]
MAGDLKSEDILKALGNGKLEPFYLFFGPDEFMLERVLDKVRADFIPESARDLNVEICYGGETSPADIINRAQSVPFMAQNRLIIVRRVEELKADQLEVFLPYLDDPSPTTCLIFISSKTDFKRKFYKKIRSLGRSVKFAELREAQIIPWVKHTAKDLGLNMDGQACLYLHQIVGNGLRDLYAELVKLQIRYGNNKVGEDEIKELAISSRIYSIFELMNSISVKDRKGAITILNRFLEEEDKKGAPLQVIGMLNRQMRLLWQTKTIAEKGGNSKDAAKKLGLAPFSAGLFIKQSKHWSEDELERSFSLLYKADHLLKSGSRPKPVMENLIMSLCG